MEQPQSIKPESYDNLIEKFNERPVLFLPEKSVISYEEVEKVRQESGANTLYACDFNIEGIEEFEEGGYFQREHIINIDHHSESPNYRKQISSTNLAIEFIRNNPGFLTNTKTITHHTDCDSVLSTLLMSSILPPEERFGVAAIAADHTGEPNEIADLLQGLKDGPEGEMGEKNTPERNHDKYLFCLEQLQNLLAGKDLDVRAQKLYQKRLQERQLLQGIITEGKVKYAGSNGEVAYMETGEEKFDATLLTGLLPNAKIIFTARQGENGKTIINVRLGLAMKESVDLRDIMNGVQEPFGGRWNAGANKRKGGSDSSPQKIAEKIANYLNRKN